MSIHNTLPYLNQPFKNIYHMMTTLSDQLGVSINEVDLYYVMIPTENESITVQFIPKQKYNNYFLQQFNENIFYIHSKQSSLVKKNNNKWEFINRIPLKNKEQLKLDFSKKKLIVTYQINDYKCGEDLKVKTNFDLFVDSSAIYKLISNSSEYETIKIPNENSTSCIKICTKLKKQFSHINNYNSKITFNISSYNDIINNTYTIKSSKFVTFWDNRKKQWRRDKISFSIKPFIVDSEFKYEGYLIANQNETNKILGIYIITKDLQKESMISTINKQFEKVIVDNISQIELIYKMKKISHTTLANLLFSSFALILRERKKCRGTSLCSLYGK